MENNNITLAQAQKEVDDWIKKYGVRYFNELTNMAILTEEVGEVARIIARKYGEQSFKESDKQKDLGDELADVLWVLICIANQTGIDLTEQFRKNIEKKTEREKLKEMLEIEGLYKEERIKSQINKINDLYNTLETNEAQYNMTVPNEEKGKDGKKKSKKVQNIQLQSLQLEVIGGFS